MWKLSVLSALMLTSFRLAESQYTDNLGCGRYKPSEGFSRPITEFVSDEAVSGEIGWTVMISRRVWDNQRHEYINVLHCNGAFIHRNAILVAASCVRGIDPEDLIVSAEDGIYPRRIENVPEYRIDTRNVSEIIFDETSQPSELNDTLAILILSKPFVLVRMQGVVCLPRENDDAYDGSKCIAGGWTENSNDPSQTILKRVKVQITPPDARDARNVEPAGPSFIRAGNKAYPDLCDVAPGSLLICPAISAPRRFFLVGLKSYRSEFENFDPNVPSQYLDVSSFRCWIDDKIVQKGLKPELYTLRLPH